MRVNFKPLFPQKTFLCSFSSFMFFPIKEVFVYSLLPLRDICPLYNILRQSLQSSWYTIPLILQFVLHSTLHIMQSLRFFLLSCWLFQLIGILFLFADFCIRFFNSDSGDVSANMKLLYFSFLLNQLLFLLFSVSALFRFLIKFWNKFPSMSNSLFIFIFRWRFF